MSEFESDNRGYDDESRGYDQDASRSPMRGVVDSRARSASPDGRDRADTRPSDNREDAEAHNPGTNLFVTGIHPRLSEADVKELFEKYGEVEKCNIMRDPHSGDSRGFGFVKMLNSEGANAAQEGLQGVDHEGRTLSIEKARRTRPRTPTPGKYYGPKKEFGRPFRGGGGGRYDDRRGGGRRDDHYGGGGGGYRGSRYGGDRYEDRQGDSYDRRYRDRNDYGRSDRYGGGGRDDRYGGRDERSDRRGGGGGGYHGREDRGNGYDHAPRDPPRESYTGGRGYDDRGDDRYSR